MRPRGNALPPCQQSGPARLSVAPDHKRTRWHQRQARVLPGTALQSFFVTRELPHAHARHTFVWRAKRTLSFSLWISFLNRVK